MSHETTPENGRSSVPLDKLVSCPCSEGNTCDTLVKLSVELAEADRRAGAAERKAASLQKSYVARQDWLRKAKEEAGYDSSVSFDIVWRDTLKKSLGY